MVIFFAAIFISAIFKALMDDLQFHYNRIRMKLMLKNPQYWNPEVSWENKYKWGEGKPKLIKWLLKNTLVFITDGWHLCQFIFLNSLFVAVLLYTPIIKAPYMLFFNFLIYRMLFGLVFNIFYLYIWVVMRPKI